MVDQGEITVLPGPVQPRQVRSEDLGPYLVARRGEMEMISRELVAKLTVGVGQCRPQIDEVGAGGQRNAAVPIVEHPEALRVERSARHHGVQDHADAGCPIPDSLHDVVTAGGDRVEIPMRPGAVEVVGADEQRDDSRFVDRVVQPLAEVNRGVASDTSVEDPEIGEELLPQAALRDAVAEEDNAPGRGGDTEEPAPSRGGPAAAGEELRTRDVQHAVQSHDEVLA